MVGSMVVRLHRKTFHLGLDYFIEAMLKAQLGSLDQRPIVNAKFDTAVWGVKSARTTSMIT